MIDAGSLLKGCFPNHVEAYVRALYGPDRGLIQVRTNKS
jgi:hypothetical protein